MVTIFGVKQGKKSWALARFTPFMILDKKNCFQITVQCTV